MQLQQKDIQSEDLMASEERFLGKIAHFLAIIQIRSCSNKKCEGKKRSRLSPMREIVISSPRHLQNIVNDVTVEPICIVCGFANANVSFEWDRRGWPPFFCFPIAYDHSCVQQVTEDEIPESYTLLETKYVLFAYTVTMIISQLYLTSKETNTYMLVPCRKSYKSSKHILSRTQ
jgi:hypothetical protein